MFEVNPNWANLAATFSDPRTYITLLLVIVFGLVVMGIGALIVKAVIEIVKFFKRHFTITITINK